MSTEQHFHGVVRGRTVELSDDPGIQSGVEVEVILRLTSPVTQSIDTQVGDDDEVADYWTEDDDRILAEIQAARENAKHRELPE